MPPFEKHNNFYTCGSSIYVANFRGAGTLGCLVRDHAGNLFGLSNNHVVSGCNYAEIGLPIVAPGILDVAAGSLDPFVIGHLAAAVPLISGVPSVVTPVHNLDVALVRIADPQLVSSMQRTSYDTPPVVADLQPNMEVEKIGRTSGRTLGRVRAHFPQPQHITYEIDQISSRTVVFFQDFYSIEPLDPSGDTAFSSRGDFGISSGFKRNRWLSQKCWHYFRWKRELDICFFVTEGYLRGFRHKSCQATTSSGITLAK